MSCHARNYGTGRTRFQLQFPIAVCERLITLPNTVSVVERSDLNCHSLSGISMQPNSCIHVAIATRLASRTRKWLVRPCPAACTGNRATVRCKKTCCENAFGIARARGVQPTTLFPDSLDGSRGVLRCRIASEGPENRPRCLRRLVQVRSTHKLIRKGVCDEIKLRPGRTNLEPIAR